MSNATAAARAQAHLVVAVTAYDKPDQKTAKDDGVEYENLPTGHDLGEQPDMNAAGAEQAHYDGKPPRKLPRDVRTTHTGVRGGVLDGGQNPPAEEVQNTDDESGRADRFHFFPTPLVLSEELFRAS
jgi:hypothetical protein